MPEPNPLLGVHVTPGAVAWAQVLRQPDGSFRVLASGIEGAPDDAAECVALAADVAARRPFRARGAFIALPDGSGCLVPAPLAADELHLAGDDLHRELHEHTPFEPDAATLRYRLVATDGLRRTYLVAAIPAAQDRRFRDAAGRHDDGTIGWGFAGAALARGARALGIAGPADFLVEVLPRTTHVYALEGDRVRRYLLVAGAWDVAEAAARATSRPFADVRAAVLSGTAEPVLQRALADAARGLVEDIRGAAAYHVAQKYAPKDAPDGLAPPQFSAAGPFLSRGPIRSALAAHLGDEFGRGPRAEPGVRVTWDPPNADLAALAGALGAALEAFAPTETRLAIVAPPREVTPRGGARTWLRAAAVVGAVAALAAGVVTVRDVLRDPSPPDAGHEPTAAVRGGVPPRTAGEGEPAPVVRGGVPPRLVGRSTGPGLAWIAWSPQGAERSTWTLVRLEPGRDAAAPGAWERVGEIAAETEGSVEDAVAGPGGVYRYRIEGDSGPAANSEIAVDVAVPVSVDVLAALPGGGARLRLTRPWKDGTAFAEADVRPGERVSTRARRDGTDIVFDADARLTGARWVTLDETRRVELPDFGPDGRVVRAADGSVPRTARETRVAAPVLEVRLEGPGPRVRTVSRKMTDG